MPADTQKKRPDLDKLRKILDNPNDPTLSTHDDKSLDSVRRRLSHTTPTTRARTAPSMQPHITIRQPQPKPEDLPLWTPQEPSTTTPATTPRLRSTDDLPLWTPIDTTAQPSTTPTATPDFSDQDLFEVELLEPTTLQFQVIDDTHSPPTTPSPTTWEPQPSTTPDTDLPSWEPVTPTTKGTVPLQEFTDITPQAPYPPEQATPTSPPEPRLTWGQRRAARKTARIQAREAKRRAKLNRSTPPPAATDEAPAEPLPVFESISHITPQTEDARDAFRAITSITDTVADLLIHHGYTTLEDLRHTTIDTIVAIKGIRRKQAKQIKHDLDAYFATLPPKPAHKKEPLKLQGKRKPKRTDDTETEWESYEISGKLHVPPVCTYKGYTLYQRETKIGRKTSTLHFFSKTPQKGGIPATLPDGYAIDVNRRTGIPFLKKKK